MLSEEEKQKRKTKFDAQPKERQIEILNSVNEQLFTVIGTKMGILPVLSALSAAMLVVATFNKELLPIDTEIKVLISVLTLLAPLSLIFYLFFVLRAEKAAYEIFEMYLGKQVQKGTLINRVLHTLPILFAIIIFIALLLFVIRFWYN